MHDIGALGNEAYEEEVDFEFIEAFLIAQAQGLFADFMTEGNLTEFFAELGIDPDLRTAEGIQHIAEGAAHREQDLMEQTCLRIQLEIVRDILKAIKPRTSIPLSTLDWRLVFQEKFFQIVDEERGAQIVRDLQEVFSMDAVTRLLMKKGVLDLEKGTDIEVESLRIDVMDEVKKLMFKTIEGISDVGEGGEKNPS